MTSCSLSLWCCRGIGEATRHPATWHTHQWRASGHTHRTRLSLRCWFCSHSMKCTTQHTFPNSAYITEGTVENKTREVHEKAQADKENKKRKVDDGLSDCCFCCHCHFFLVLKKEIVQHCNFPNCHFYPFCVRVKPTSYNA